jgi:hypothetical protein
MNETNDLVREASQLLADYEQVELGLLRLVTWNQKRRDLLERLDLLRELALVLADYDLIAGGHIERATWRQKMALMLARAKQAGVKVVPF